MRKYRYLCLLWVTLAFPAFAGNGEAPAQAENESSTAVTDPAGRATGTPSRDLPEQWESLTHSQWLNTLNIADCAAEDQGRESRRTNRLRLDDSTQLLLLICEMGAYQDGFHVYLVSTERNTVTSVSLQTPQREGETKSETFVRGALYKGDPGNVVELLHLSAATGACGWRARYSIEAVKSGGPVEPETVFGDDDCYNGVTVEHWPVVE